VAVEDRRARAKRAFFRNAAAAPPSLFQAPGSDGGGQGALDRLVPQGERTGPGQCDSFCVFLSRPTSTSSETSDDKRTNENEWLTRAAAPLLKTQTLETKQGLRVHDNPALLDACRDASHVFPIYVLDPWFVSSGQYR